MIYFLVFICILGESALVAYPLTLSAIVLINIVKKKDLVFLAFFSGLILDIFTQRLLGISSLYFLLLILLSVRYRQKIHEGAFFYRLGYLLLALFIYNFFFYKNITLISAVATIAAGTTVLLWLER